LLETGLPQKQYDAGERAPLPKGVMEHEILLLVPTEIAHDYRLCTRSAMFILFSAE
jgi:hypothetical protein